jgi:cupin 2 domain-containing protein
MADDDLHRFLDKVRQLQDFVSLSQAQPELRQNLRDCSSHHQVVALAALHGFSIGRRWGESDAGATPGSDNLLVGEAPPAGEERTRVLLETPELRLECIHSCAAMTPAGEWYDQAEAEWVLLLRGSARLRFENEAQPRELNAGDSLLISPGRLHRVEATDPAPGTLWLALFWTPGA